MFSEKFVRESLKKVLKKADDFAIYPYGTNGMTVDFCLKNVFDITASIIDNKYCNYSGRIASISDFRRDYSGEYVILTIEDSDLNKKMEAELLSFIQPDHIINLYSKFYQEEEVRIQRLNSKREESHHINSMRAFAFESFFIDNILPCKDVDVRTSCDVIKMAIVVREPSSWNVFASFVKEISADDRYEVMIISSRKKDDDLKNVIEKAGYGFAYGELYDVAKEQPDYLIINFPILNDSYDGLVDRIREYRKNAKCIVAVCSDIVKYDADIYKLWYGYWFRAFHSFAPDYLLFDKLLYEEICKIKGIVSNRVIEMGNPKFDDVWIARHSNKEYLQGWEKLRGRKVFFWGTTHGINNGIIHNGVSFDVYAKDIFEYAKRHEDCGFVIRLHQYLVYELIEKEKCWSVEDYEQLKEYCTESDNIVWDETDDYCHAFNIADAVLLDWFCGMTLTALPTLLPVAILYRNEHIKDTIHPQITEQYYSIRNQKELTRFFDMVKRDEDPKYDRRRALIGKYVSYYDGQNGKRLKAFFDTVVEERRCVQ